MLSYMEYGLAGYNQCLVCERKDKVQWPYSVRKQSLPESSLEDEIIELRNRMEQAFTENNSLTAEIVIEISRMLDLKINEYMLSTQRARAKS